VTSSLERRCKNLVADLGIAASTEVLSVKPLTGGVGSDIAVIDLGKIQLCAKFALPQLKVAEDWHAPVHRNRAEYKWLEFAAQVAPESAIELYGLSELQHGFVMEYMQGKDVYLWKSALLEGRADQNEAAMVGDLIGRIHNRSSADGFNATPFQNQKDFQAIRLDPYLNFTASHWPQYARQLNDLADRLYHSDQVLVHGDVSPKNILIRDGLPVILDAECATMGDPSFDCSFCLNHLILKAVHVPASRSELIESIFQFWRAYTRHVSWESVAGLEKRICQLIPALMLARVDGKSPVEYLGDTERAIVRKISTAFLETFPANLHQFSEHFTTQLKESEI